MDRPLGRIEFSNQRFKYIASGRAETPNDARIPRRHIPCKKMCEVPLIGGLIPLTLLASNPIHGIRSDRL